MSYIVKVSGANLCHPAYPGDVGHDLLAAETVRLYPGDTRLVPTGVYLEMPEQIWAQILDKSSVAARDIQVVGGVIDPNYRGEIQVLLHNGGRKDKFVSYGDAVAQLVFRQVVSVELVSVEAIGLDTERGEKGFGSSGNKIDVKT